MLTRFHPEQDAYVFGGLKVQEGAGTVLSVGTFLDRLDALESGAERPSTREADAAALAPRGITPEERARLQGLPVKAQSPPSAPTADEKRESLKAPRLWYED